MEQPNVTGDGSIPLTPFFWLLVVATRVATGLFGDFMMVILFGMQHLAYGYHSGSFEAAVERAPAIRRAGMLVIAGAFGGPAWYLLRTHTKGEKSEVDDVIWEGGEGGRLSLRRSLGTSVISEIVIGMTASIGREAAPKLMGGVTGSLLADWFHLSPAQRRPLIACGGGAGLAAVYNVPLDGAVHRRDPAGHPDPAGDPADPGLLVHRHRHRVALPPPPRHLPEHPRLPFHLAADGVGAAGRAGDRGDRLRLPRWAPVRRPSGRW
jgi:hypothetical protein